ncbi:hillarin-like [Haliotis rufescens]|uniref:hillarin-like n=1 Tax=Haliotis rufescens TaxID=6454 RepID=UPI00201F5B8A|nr:hillarin-like [Haliotis rufescens]
MGSGTSSSKVLTDDPDIDPITVPDTVKGYRPPSPPKWKKRDVFDVKKSKELDSRARQVTVTDDTTFEALASDLTRDLSTDLERVRALFIWLGHQDIEKQFYPGVTDGRTPRGYMKLMKLHKGSYSSFFALLCRAANLQCVIVRGHVKSLGYEVGDQDVTRLIGNWNIVHVDGSWQIVHPLWAFTGVIGHDSGRWVKIEADGKGTREKGQARQGISIKDLDEDFFLPHPEEFIYTCMAEKREWQLVSDTWDLHTFCNVPRFEFRYFTSGYKLIREHKSILLSENGKCELEFEEKRDTKTHLAYDLYFDEALSKDKLPEGIELPRCVFLETNGKHLRLIVRFHVAGIYKLSIKYNILGIISVPMAAFKLEVSERSENKNMFPVNPPIGFGFGQTAKVKGLAAPSHKSGVVVMEKRTMQTFNFRMTTRMQVVARLRHNKMQSEELDQYVEQEVKDENVKVKVTMPDDGDIEEYALQIYTGEESKDNNVVNYLLTSRKEDFEKIQEDKVRKNLQIALGGHRISRLEKAIKDFEVAKLKDTNGYLRKAKLKMEKLRKEQRKEEEINSLKRNLKKALKHRSLTDLEKAIADAERSGHPDLEELLLTAKAMAVDLEQEEIDGQKASDIRDQLISATKARKKKGLEAAIASFQEANLPDRGDLTEARTVLQQLYEEAVEKEMSKQNLKRLEAALNGIEDSVVEQELRNSQVIQKAQRFLQQQKRLKGFLSPILLMKNGTVAEIHGYRDTNPLIVDVMKATFITLGESQNELESWSAIQKHLTPSLKILQRIKAFNLESLHFRTADRARKLLDKYTTDDVREVSAGLATFYKWCNSILQEAPARHDQD